EMLWRPEKISETMQTPQRRRIGDLLLDYTIPSTLSAIGDDRLAWLRTLSFQWSDHELCVVHAGPDDVRQVISPDTADHDLERIYGPLRSTRVVYGHIHRPYVRPLSTFVVANSGSVGMPYDGDTRASYLLIDGDRLAIRRVEYDLERE